ncbi:MAG: tryptophan 7-halogenase [Flavobacteriaceae bacterium]|nr:tryptophan 7-halogenase [Flavobacteriaceae bacterium]
MKPDTIDVLIIGAGPSGAVSAGYLNQQKKDILLVEKVKFPRYVIGESLIPRCMDHFEAAGLLACLKKQNYEVKRGARFLRKDEVCLFDFSKKHGDGWDWTWQIPRDHFDHTLTQELERKGVPILWEWEVTHVDFDTDLCKTVLKHKNGEIKTILSKYIIDASGYGRVLPRLLDLDRPSTLDDHSSIFTQVADSQRPDGEEGTLISFDIVEKEVWLWVIPFSNGNTSIGVVAPTLWLNNIPGTPAEKLQAVIAMSDHYKTRFTPYEPIMDTLRITTFSKSVKQLYGDRYVLTGNSSEFLDPVFSSGVSFATESGILAAKLLNKQLNGESVDWQTQYADYIAKGVAVFSTYVKEWYTGNLQKLFFHRPENPEVKRQICAVLAGYVWDDTNPFVKKHHRIVKTLAHLIDMETETETN